MTKKLPKTLTIVCGQQDYEELRFFMICNDLECKRDRRYRYKSVIRYNCYSNSEIFRIQFKLKEEYDGK